MQEFFFKLSVVSYQPAEVKREKKELRITND